MKLGVVHDCVAVASSALRVALALLVLIGTGVASAQMPTSGSTFKECDECPEMVVIPSGSFFMGSPNDEAGRSDAEGPVHRVKIAAPFALGKTHVTRGQFAAFVAATGYAAGSACYVFEEGRWIRREGRNWRDPGFRQEDNHPAVCINWDDARAYADWLSRKTGKTYRLPSEAELEYAIRGGTTMARWWGDSADDACQYANVADQTARKQVSGASGWAIHNCQDGYGYTAPVGSFKINGFGLYDMLGNAWQWTEDCWNKDHHGAPTDGSPRTTGECGKRVLRGGSWASKPATARSAYRLWCWDCGDRINFNGFRVARMLP